MSGKIPSWRTQVQRLSTTFGQGCCQKDLSQEVQDRELMNWRKGYVLMYFSAICGVNLFNLSSEELLLFLSPSPFPQYASVILNVGYVHELGSGIGGTAKDCVSSKKES